MKLTRHLAVVGLILAMSATAWGLTWVNPPGNQHIKLNIFDWSMSKSYDLTGGGASGIGSVDSLPAFGGLPQISVPGAQVITKAHPYSGAGLVGMTEDNWTVVMIREILVDTIEDPTQPVLWSDAVDPSSELIGLVYGGVDNYAGARIGGEQIVGAEGFFYDIYEQPKGTFDAALGSSGRIAFDKYIGAGYSWVDDGDGIPELGEEVLVGTKIIEGVSTPGVDYTPSIPAPAPTTIPHRISEFTPSAVPFGSGWGERSEFIDAIGGTWQEAPLIGIEVEDQYFPDRDPRHGLSQLGDLHAESTITPYLRPEGDWILSSDDPIVGYMEVAPEQVIPEPMTIVGALLGVAGVVNYVRKRRIA